MLNPYFEGYNNYKMRWCTGALAKMIFQLFCVWRSRGRRKGDPNINVVGKRCSIKICLRAPKIQPKVGNQVGHMRSGEPSRAFQGVRGG